MNSNVYCLVDRDLIRKEINEMPVESVMGVMQTAFESRTVNREYERGLEDIVMFLLVITLGVGIFHCSQNKFRDFRGINFRRKL